MVTKVCVDDFAIRKRHTYGTIMVDMESRRVIDLLPSREIEDVVEWLKTYPNLSIVSRDGSVSYHSAISQANTAIVQVSDRFHPSSFNSRTFFTRAVFLSNVCLCSFVGKSSFPSLLQ